MKSKRYISARDFQEHSTIHYSDIINKNKRPTSVYNISIHGLYVEFNVVGVRYRCRALLDDQFEVVEKELDTIDRSGIPVSIPSGRRVKGRSVD